MMEEEDVTCHVAVDQLRFDRPAAVHVDVKIPRRVAAVFVRFTGLFVNSWKEKINKYVFIQELRRGLCGGLWVMFHVNATPLNPCLIVTDFISATKFRNKSRSQQIPSISNDLNKIISKGL